MSGTTAVERRNATVAVAGAGDPIGAAGRAAMSDIYGVVLTGEIADKPLAVGIAATIARRGDLAAARHA
jgi:hypothetical protein